MQLRSLLLVLAVAAVSCSGGDDPAPTAPASTSTVPSVPSTIVTTTTTDPSATTSGTDSGRPIEYLPNREVTLFLPQKAEQAPVVVLVPGGGWRTADPSGLADLGEELADRGVAAMTVRVGAARDGVVYPTPVQDIRCALGFAVEQARDGGIRPGPVVVLGHSSGAHLASLVALQDRPPPEGCSDVPGVDGLVGLAGVYDIERLPALAFLLLGETPEEAPDLWEEANPLLQAESNPELPALLLHGDADALVPVSFSEAFRESLEEGGHDTTLQILPDIDHREIYAPEVVGEIVADWVLALADG